MDAGIGTVFAIFAILDDQFTVDTISAVFTIFTNSDTVTSDILVHLDGQTAVFLVTNNFQVFTGIVGIVFRAFALDGQCSTQITMNLDIIVTYEIEALSRQVRGSLTSNVLHITDVSSVIPVFLTIYFRIVHLAIQTAGSILDLLAAGIDACLSNARSICNLKACTIYNCSGRSLFISFASGRCISGTVQARQILVEFNQQFAIIVFLVSNDSDIIVDKIRFFGIFCQFTTNGNGLVQFHCCASAKVTGIFLTVFRSCQRIVFTIFPILAVIIDNAGNGFTVFAIDARFTLDDMDTSIGTVFAIFTILND